MKRRETMDLLRAGPARTGGTLSPLRGPTVQQEVAASYHAHAAILLRYATTSSRSADIAWDAVQETFLRYFLARTGGEQIESTRAWLFRVLRNYLLDCFRSADARGEVSLTQMHSAFDPHQNPERAVLLQEVEDALSPRQLECLRLRAAGLSYEEIARVLRIRKGTVGALLARALRRVKKQAVPRPMTPTSPGFTAVSLLR